MEETFDKIKQPYVPDKKDIQQGSTEKNSFGDITKKGAEQDIRERKRYARRVYKFYKWWMLGLIAIVLIGGAEWSKSNGFSFDISEKVLLMLTGTTTLGVLGSFFVIVRYLFSTKRR